MGNPTTPDIRTSAASEFWREADRVSPRTRILLPGRQGNWYASMKPSVDFLTALALLVPILPFILLAWILVKLSSRGPGFYIQTRTGRAGLPYRIIKVRSMHHKAEEAHGGPKWSHAGDERIFSMGKVLRRTHLDELPQLLNVLRGEMSLVGPRPERPEVIASKGLCDEVPGYEIRMVARPGITGLAQVQLPSDSDIRFDYFERVSELPPLATPSASPKRSYWFVLVSSIVTLVAVVTCALVGFVTIIRWLGSL